MKKEPDLEKMIEEIQQIIDENQNSVVRFVHVGTLMDILFLLKEQEAVDNQPSKSCSYYAENGKKPCCTHDCDGCTWYV